MTGGRILLRDVAAPGSAKPSELRMIATSCSRIGPAIGVGVGIVRGRENKPARRPVRKPALALAGDLGVYTVRRPKRGAVLAHEIAGLRRPFDGVGGACQGRR